MTQLYHDAQRRLQDRFDTARLADRIEERIVHDLIDEGDAEFTWQPWIQRAGRTAHIKEGTRDS